MYSGCEVICMDIRGMRMQLGDTQSEFAVRYQIPFRTVQNWEAGVRKPPEYMANLLEQRIREDLINRNDADALQRQRPSNLIVNYTKIC